jgi:hypothetical protein
MLFAVVFMLFPGGTADQTPCQLAAPVLTVQIQIQLQITDLVDLRRGRTNMCHV